MKHIFRAYDIRGIYPKDLNDLTAFNIGRAVGTLLKRNLGQKSMRVVVGRDTRQSSPVLAKNLINGLVAAGCNVVDTGISLTPIIHFLTCTQNFDVGIEVTASHNPKEFNGFRLDYKNALPFSSEDITKLYNLIKNDDFETGVGSVKEIDLTEEYVKFLKEAFVFKKGFKIVIDCGYGTSSLFVKNIFDALGADVDLISCVSNNDFSRGVPDPENPLFIQNLQTLILEHGADIGFTFDQDCDRFGVVDSKGNIYSADLLLLLFAKDILVNNSGRDVVFDVKCSGILEDFITSWRGNAKRIRTGHTFFVRALAQGAILGGEFSGHVYFGDKYFGYDDGIYAVCRLIELLQLKNDPLDVLMKEFMLRVSPPEIKILCADDKKVAVVNDIKKTILEGSGRNETGFLEVLDIDGVRVKISKTGWFLIRPSNTSPYLSVRVEGADKDELALILEGVKGLLKKYDYLDIDGLKLMY